MPQTHRNALVEELENQAAQLSRAREASKILQVKLDAAIHKLLRMSRLIRTPEQLHTLDEMADLLLDCWDEVAEHATTTEAAHEAVKRIRGKV